MKQNYPLLISILSVFLFVGCKQTIIFDERITFPDNNWAFENKEITFATSISGSENAFSVILELELVGTPNVDRFYATFSMFSPHGANAIKSIVFNFVSPQEPYIKGNSANEKIYRLTVYPKKYFSETGTYTFIVDQYSNKADNYGIRALRMYIEKAKE